MCAAFEHAQTFTTKLWLPKHRRRGGTPPMPRLGALPDPTVGRVLALRPRDVTAYRSDADPLCLGVKT